MMTFSTQSDLQGYCCCVLRNLSNKLAIHQAGGVPAICMAMRNHPKSVHVQSEACTALQLQASVLHSETSHTIRTMLTLVEHAKDMYLTATGKASTIFLMGFLPSLFLEIST